ncbi:hypothetical protein B0H14DRAFT_3423235 [Mycena olivaceomarginata]|nr:hypothetical protein B0H14DRAFT_3423235 [Mycena olivaceomarginata]
MPPTRPSRRVMKANIEEAKNAAADPTNRSKALEYQYLAADYAERFEFGVYEADAAVNRYIAARTRREFVMDQLRHAAVSCCPFDSGGSLEEYYDAAAAFHRDFGRAYQAEDGLDDVLATKRKLRRIYKGLMLLETEEQAELVAQETYRFSVKNPFPAHDPRRMRVDTKLRELLALCNEWSPKKLPSTLHVATLTVALHNMWSADPLSKDCIKRYCYQQMWAADIKALMAGAARELATDP